MPPSSKAVIWSNGACVCVRVCVRERETGRLCPMAVFEQSSPPLVCLEKPLCCPSPSSFFISVSCFFSPHDAAGKHVRSVLKNKPAGEQEKGEYQVSGRESLHGLKYEQ